MAEKGVWKTNESDYMPMDLWKDERIYYVLKPKGAYPIKGPVPVWEVSHIWPAIRKYKVVAEGEGDG